MKRRRLIQAAITAAVVSVAAFVFAVTIRSDRQNQVDFVFYEGFDWDEIVVPIGLGNFCHNKGASVFPGEGVLFDNVRIDGVELEGYRNEEATRHRSDPLIVSPGPGFTYVVSMNELWSRGSEPTRIGKTFKPTGRTPETIGIEYRIRCADGATSRTLKISGKRISLPRVPDDGL